MAFTSHLSIRTILGLVIGTMGLLLVSLSTTAVIDAFHHHRAARQVATLSTTSQSLFKALQAIRNERGLALTQLKADGLPDPGARQLVSDSRNAAESGLTKPPHRLLTWICRVCRHWSRI